MTTFSDDFNRADGGLGNGWIVVGGSNTIISNQLGQNYGALCRNENATAAGRQEVTLTYNVVNGTEFQSYPIVKYDNTNASNIFAYNNGNLSVPTWTLGITRPNATTTTKTISGGAIPTGAFTVRLLYQSGMIYLYAGGVLITAMQDAACDANTLTGVGCRGNVGRVDAFSFLGDESLELSVSPSPIGNFGASVSLTFTGNGTAWTPGTPGTPTFTVDHGTLSDQVVNSATVAHATYTPGTFLGMATFTDPSTGAICQVQVTSDPSIAPPPSGPGGLSQDALDWLNAQAAHGGLVLADNDQLNFGGGSDPIKDALSALTDWMSGHVSPESLIAPGEEWGGLLGKILNNNALPDGTHNIYDYSSTAALYATTVALAFAEFRNPPTYTIADMMDNLRGTGAWNHTDLMQAIEAIPTGDNQEVLDAIAAAQGDPLATIKAVLDRVFLLDPTGAHDLAELLAAVAAVRGAGSPSIATVMGKLGPGGTSLETQINALSSLIVTETTIQGLLDIAVGVLAGAPGSTIDGVLDALDLLPDQVAAAIQPAAPLWPGLAGVTLGDQLALSNGLVVPGPMHGLLFTITGQPPGAGKYAFGDVDSWQHTGGVVFCTDNGYYERAESFGIEAQIVVPKTMEQAASAIVRLNAGWSGTVRPWTRTA